MPAFPASNATSRLVTLVSVIMIVAVLYFARAVLIPLALAILLCFLLGPLVNRLEKLHLGRIASVIVVTALSFAALGGIGYVLAGEVIRLADQLPHYKDNIRAKAEWLFSPSVFTRASENIQEMAEDVIRASTAPSDAAPGEPAVADEPGASDEPASPPAGADPEPSDEPPSFPLNPPAVPVDEASPSAAAPVKPVPVELHEREPNPLEFISSMLDPLIHPLISAGIVIVFVIFMLIQREDLRDRFIRLIGPGQLTVTTQAMDDAAHRVSSYLRRQLLVNVTYGVPVAIGLLLIGVPNAILWGVLCIVMRYIPYVGPWLGASMPILLSLAVFDGWKEPALVIGMFVVLEIVSNNFIEPWLYGKGTGISSVAVLLAAVFWTWLWGPVGLVLATPLTVCLVVIGRYFPQLQFLTILLGDEPGLPLPTRVYQRLLALDQDGAFRLAQHYLKEHTRLELYDNVLAPALQLAERDRHRGELDEARGRAVYDGLRTLIDEIGEEAADKKKVEAAKAAHAEGAEVTAAVSPPAAARARPCLLCLPARDEADELAARMLAQLLSSEGFCAEAVGTDSLAGEVLELVEQRDPAALCISAMPPMAVTHSRYLCKRLSARFPKLRMVVGVWNASDVEQAEQRIRTCGAETVVTTFAQAMEKLRV